MPGMRKLVPEALCGKPRRFRSGKEEAPVFTQAINYMIQSQPSAIPMGRINRLYGENKPLDEKIAGQVRMNVENQRLVCLLRFIYEETKGGETIILWHVREVLSGECYRLKQRSIGRHYNEMEVLAWASR